MSIVPRLRERVVQGLRTQAMEPTWCSSLVPNHHVVKKPSHMARPFAGVWADTPAKASAGSQHQPLDTGLCETSSNSNSPTLSHHI